MAPQNPVVRINPLALMEILQRALARIAGGALLSDALDELARMMETQSGNEIHASILLWNEDGNELHAGATPSLPASFINALSAISRGGAVTASLFGKEPVHVANVAAEPLWGEYRDLVLSHDLKACWSTPVHGARGTLLGALACFSRSPRFPSPEEIDAIAAVTRAVAIIIERHESEQEAKSAHGRYRQIFNSATDVAIVSTGVNGVVTSWNEGAHQILGWTEEEMLGQTLHRFFTPEDVAGHVPEKEMQCALEQAHAPDERWHLRKNGGRFWGVGSLSPLQGDDGKVVGFVKILRDQTQRKRVETQFRELNATLEDQVAQRTRERDRIWRNSLDLLLVISRDGILRAVNPVWTASLGYETGELIDHHFAPFVHPKDVQSTIKAIRHASLRPLAHFEVRLRHKDGTYRWFAWRAVPEGGMVYANGRDITVEKRQAEQLLLASEARLQLALAAGEMGAWEWNLHSDEIIWLHGAAQVHGVSPADKPLVFSRADYMQYIHPEDRQTWASAMADARIKGKSHRAEYRVVWPDGSMHWVEARGHMLFDDAGKALHMVGVSTNITRRKRTEHDLKFLALTSAELAGLTDPQSTLDRLAYLAVPSFADWCAVDLLEKDGSLRRVAVAHTDTKKLELAHEFHRRFPPDPDLPQGEWQVLRSGTAEFVREVSDEMIAQSIRDPEHLAAIRELGIRSYIGVPLTAHGKTMGVVTFVSAESGRLYEPEDMALAEDMARRAAVAIENAELYRSLRDSDRAKDVFLATLAHELRNPLAAIVNGLAIMTLTAHDAKRVEHYTKLIERQAGQLTRLVDDLMDISRISTGKIELRKELTNLADVLNNAIETSAPYIEAEHHELTVVLPAEPALLRGDPVRLAQVFSNLLTNAAKYTNHGGKIRLTLESAPNEFTIRVADTGIGIPADMLKHVFKVFTQVTHPLERRRGGLGIGLSLVEGLVHLHGGRVEALSGGPNQGSEFVVRLSRLAESALPTASAATNAPADARPVPRQRRILVVDDNLDAATSLADILRSLGHQVTAVHDGLAAVAAAFELQPDTILLDIGLPGIDGYEAARRIRAQEGLHRVTVLIALTGWGQANDKQRAYQAGFDHHWVKPATLEQLTDLPTRK